MIWKPWPYQAHAVQHAIDNPASGLLMEMGLGKSSVTCTTIDKLIYDYMQVSKVLIVAPLKVAENVWDAEISKWDHLKHLTISKVLGDEKQRKAALKVKADMYVINYDNLPWLQALVGLKSPFDMIVLDESSKIKNPASKRFRAALKLALQAQRILILTGTPIPNGIQDIWAQVYALDRGQRLEDKIGAFREKYLKKENPYDLHSKSVLREGDTSLGLPKDFYAQKIYDKIGDICISMKAKDYLDLPARIDTDIEISFSPKTQAMYDEFEKTEVLKLLEEEISPVNAAALQNKLLQFANGAVYGNEGNGEWHEVHNEKLEALAEAVEAVQGQPVLVAYQYKHDLARLLKYFKEYKPEAAGAKDWVNRWNEGKIQMCFAHPASMGHGLNLQHGGHHLFWFGTGFNLEYYLQFVARLDRQGQTKPVINGRLIVKGTPDVKAIRVVEGKEVAQDALMAATKALISKYVTT